jgi:hypothetical protein
MEHWTPELRRAVMLAKPEFFTWPAHEQLRYRVDLPDEDRVAFVAALLRETGHRRPAALAKLESNGRIALPLQNQINAWLLPLSGVGEDAFVLNEHMAEGQSILDFETLHAYDAHDHAFQQKAREEHDDPYVPEPYTGALHATWARVLLNGRICYLTLSMASWHLCGTMEEAADEEIQRLVPHRHVRGPDDGAVESGMVRWDFRVDASGQEALLDELKRRVWTEQDRRRRELGQAFQQQRSGATFLDGSPWPGEGPDEQNLHIVFTDPDALAAVRFTSFLRDCRRLQRPLPELRALESHEADRMRAFVKAQQEDLVKNFDPKVVPLRKKRKILMHPEALRDMDDASEPSPEPRVP